MIICVYMLNLCFFNDYPYFELKKHKSCFRFVLKGKFILLCLGELTVILLINLKVCFYGQTTSPYELKNSSHGIINDPRSGCAFKKFNTAKRYSALPSYRSSSSL